MSEEYRDYLFLRKAVTVLHIESLIFISFLLAILQNGGITFFAYALYFMWVFVPMEKMCWEKREEVRWFR